MSVQSYSFNNSGVSDINIMDDHIQSILVAISKNPVTNVVSLAGTGKSTNLPIGIAESGNKIMVVVSDDAIAKSLMKYTKTLSVNINQGDIVYISRRELKNRIYKIISKHGCIDLPFTDILMIDEADSNSLDNSVIEILWRYCAEKRARVPRLLLVSSIPVKSNLFDIYHYDINTISYPIEIRYSNKNYPTQVFHHDQLVPDTIDLIYETHASSTEGDILVFATGENQIESIVKLLKSMRIEGCLLYTSPSPRD